MGIRMPPVEVLAMIFRRNGFPEPEREVLVSPDRRFRFDLAWSKLMLAAEYEGGVWNRGRHTRAIGYTNDAFKYSLAALLGWSVVRVTQPMIEDGRADELAQLAAGSVLRV